MFISYKPIKVGTKINKEDFDEQQKSFTSLNMGPVRYRHAVSIDATRIAVVYDDWRSELAGRVYDLRLLEELDFDRRQPIQTALGIVLGELVEPTDEGRERDSAVLKPINAKYPGIHWFGSVP
ncbi:hypothetical protein [Arthrobacter bambusae]|uniref:Uncharacterized protein n=1 Tax=Arthrobacter bambusae TaxID=1338426 RepID=A0AAW8DE23_9MICC|nr:hypothetical protein [Arthrobacter bambusae]MDP9907076.1 hypothetical protein [Arthrobacter bambusae]MDQ0131965.1 hypothetical protein [Arthrobacter bambusae]MDQ0183312.1 hypothetical protein [Arthrobacter bambusae]